MVLENDPIHVHQAMKSVNSQLWLNATNKEMQFIKDN